MKQRGKARALAFRQGESRARCPRLVQRRSEEHTSELQSRLHLVCRLLLEKKTSRDSPAPQHPPALHRQQSQPADNERRRLAPHLGRPPARNGLLLPTLSPRLPPPLHARSA